MTNFSGSKTVEVTVEDVTREVEVEYVYTPGCAAVMTLPNGDPGYPAEHPEVEVTGVFFEVDGKREDVIRFFTYEPSEAVQDAILEEGPDEPDEEPDRDDEERGRLSDDCYCNTCDDH